jgi:hypothetical protein
MGEGTGLPDYLGALRQIWPGERALSRPTLHVETRAPLVGRDGLVRGHLGLLEAGPVACASHHERLGPLARVAAAEVEAWSRPSLS